MGGVWNDAAIRNGLFLAEVLDSEESLRRWEVVEIDLWGVGCDTPPEGSEVTLITRDGNEIRWGRAPLSPANDPRFTERKLHYLRHAEMPRQGLRSYIDIVNDPPAFGSLHARSSVP
jgi:hypothetical protein